ncbi:hypothetical protein GQX74_013486 [Glossina fuscipes]|nr:hypothetical protein GQX74_013486 [Glossina fuscipes]
MSSKHKSQLIQEAEVQHDFTLSHGLSVAYSTVFISLVTIIVPCSMLFLKRAGTSQTVPVPKHELPTRDINFMLVISCNQAFLVSIAWSSLTNTSVENTKTEMDFPRVAIQHSCLAMSSPYKCLHKLVTGDRDARQTNKTGPSKALTGRFMPFGPKTPK